jgi:hypothetical protein
VNAVAGRYELEPDAPDPESTQSTLVFIGRTIERDDLKARCAALVA